MKGHPMRGEMLDLSTREGCVHMRVRVQPQANKNEIAGTMEGALKIRLQASAVENRANEGLCAYLAELLKRPKTAVRIRGGERSRNKRIEIQGVTEQEIRGLLEHEV